VRRYAQTNQQTRPAAAPGGDDANNTIAGQVFGGLTGKKAARGRARID
jgi:hypothetical protein